MTAYEPLISGQGIDSEPKGHAMDAPSDINAKLALRPPFSPRPLVIQNTFQIVLMPKGIDDPSKHPHIVIGTLGWSEHGDARQRLADGKRLADCWNACRGIPDQLVKIENGFHAVVQLGEDTLTHLEKLQQGVSRTGPQTDLIVNRLKEYTMDAPSDINASVELRPFLPPQSLMVQDAFQIVLMPEGIDDPNNHPRIAIVTRGWPLHRDDGQRLVDCWNACKGIPDQLVKSGLWNLVEHGKCTLAYLEDMQAPHQIDLPVKLIEVWKELLEPYRTAR